jgi:hypothetical protein
MGQPGVAWTARAAGPDRRVRPGRRPLLHIRPIHRQRSSVPFKPFANTHSVRWRYIVQRNRANIGMRRGCDLPARNAVVYHRAPARNNTAGRDRVIKNSRRMVARQLMPAQIAFQEMIRANKSKMIRSQAKCKIVPCRMTAEREPDTRNKS